MVKDHSAREENRCCLIGYYFRLAARVLLYASSHRQDNTYHSLCYTCCRALAGKGNSSHVMNEGMFNNSPAQKQKSLIECQKGIHYM